MIVRGAFAQHTHNCCDWAYCTCRPGLGKMTSELVAQKPEYTSMSHHQMTQQLPSYANMLAYSSQQDMQIPSGSRHTRAAHLQQQIGNRWLVPHQAMVRAQVDMGILTPHNSLASLASSMRSEEQAGLSFDKQLPGRAASGHEGFDPQLVSLCRQSEEFRRKSIGRRSEEFRRKSLGSPASPASSVNNFVQSNSGSLHSLSRIAQSPGSRAGLGSPSTPRDPQWSGLESRPNPLDSQTDDAEDGSTSFTSTKQLSPHVASREGSARIPSVPTHAACAGRLAAVTPMAPPLSTALSGQLGSSDSDCTSQDIHGRVQGEKVTCQRADVLTRQLPPSGQQRRQPLIPYRGGDTELPVREQSLSSIDSQLVPTSKQLKLDVSCLCHMLCKRGHTGYPACILCSCRLAY